MCQIGAGFPAIDRGGDAAGVMVQRRREVAPPLQQQRLAQRGAGLP